MQRIIPNTLRTRTNGFSSIRTREMMSINVPAVLPQKTKMLAWGIFLVYFIEQGTLGIIPKNLYFIYRNVRVSDFLIYGLTIYSFFCNREYLQLYKSKTVIILKLMLVYLMGQFIVSCMLYDYNILEYFFRLKGIWISFLVFPFLLLVQRQGFPYLIKLVLPVAIVSNVLYILSALTGVAFLPEIGIEKQNLPGGLQVFRVYGGTFFGEYFFLGFIYYWITKKIRLWQFFLILLFGLPQVLAFGRSAWLYYVYTIILMFIWYSLKKREFRIALRQVILLSVMGLVLIYTFMRFIPRSDYLTEAIQARIGQGEEDYSNKEGTYGTRLTNIDALIELWLNNNVLFGIGMHPLWVVKAETVEENIYAWGFSDVGWAGVLAAYGIIGFLMCLYFQSSFLYFAAKILKRSKQYDLYTFFVLIFFSKLFFDGVINYSYAFFTSGLWGFGTSVFFIAALTYKYEHLND